MRVEDILRQKGGNVATISPEASVVQALAQLRDRDIGALVVSTSMLPVAGIISERDIVRSIAERGAEVLSETVERNMTSPVIRCAPDELLTDAMGTMTARRFRHMPVVDAGELVGIVSIGDLVKHRLDELEHEASSLRTYIATA